MEQGFGAARRPNPCSNVMLGVLAPLRSVRGAAQTGLGMSMNSTSRPWRSASHAPEGADAEALGGVVPGGDEVDTILGGLVQHPLGRPRR